MLFKIGYVNPWRHVVNFWRGAWGKGWKRRGREKGNTNGGEKGKMKNNSTITFRVLERFQYDCSDIRYYFLLSITQTHSSK